MPTGSKPKRAVRNGVGRSVRDARARASSSTALHARLVQPPPLLARRVPRASPRLASAPHGQRTSTTSTSRRRRPRVARRQGDRTRRDDADGRARSAGFTITTDACRAFMADARASRRARPRRSTARWAGSSRRPASASARRRPAARLRAVGRRGLDAGMMDTILNLGLNDEADGRARGAHRQPAVRFDSYSRLMQMFGEVVDGIDAHRSRPRSRA